MFRSTGQVHETGARSKEGFELILYDPYENKCKDIGGCAKCKELKTVVDPDKEAGQEWVLEDPVFVLIVDIKSLTKEACPALSRNVQNARDHW